MYKAVKSVIAKNAGAWAGLPAFESVFITFQSKVDQLEQLGYNQRFLTVGVIPLKNAKREEAGERFHAIVSSIMAYAVISKKVDLYNQMKISKWEIIKGARQDALRTADFILAKATEHLSELAPYGIDQQVVDELQVLRDELYAQLDAPRNAVVERKTATAQLNAITKELNLILKLQLDKLMEIIKADAPEFYAAYKNARITIDLRNPSREDESNEGGYGE